MKQHTNTSIEKNEFQKNEYRQNRESFVARLQHDLNAIPLDSQLKEEIKAKETKIKEKAVEQIAKQPSMFEYFAKLLQTSNFKPTLIPKVANVINNANEAFFTSVRENKIKFAETPQDLSILITENYKGKKFEDFARKKHIKDVSLMKQDLEKKLMTVGMELEMLKAREFSTPNHKNDNKLSEEKQREIDEFIKKKAFERRELEFRRKERVTKMLEEMKAKEEELKHKENVLRQSANTEKLDRIQKNIEEIQQRMKEREEEAANWKKTLKELKKKAPPDPFKKFEETQKALLAKSMQEELSKIKEKVKPINQADIKEFMNKHDEEIRLKKEQKLQELKEIKRQLKEREKDWGSGYYYEKAVEEIQNNTSNYQKTLELLEEKKKKIKKFEEKRKERYLPTIDEDKKEQIQQSIEKLNTKKVKRLISKKHESTEPLEEWNPEEAQVLDPRVKGKEYLEYMRSLKKKEKNGTKSAENLSRIEEKTGSVMSDNKERPVLKNYMKEVRNILAKKNDLRSLKNVIDDNSLSENVKRDQIKAQSAYWEEKAKRIEEGLKIKKKKENGKKDENNKDDLDEINELYLNSVKAKLALFKD